ncbi:Cytochrome b5-like Heme/Steroid binding domain protein [Caloramator mitchellensis]|uniref:Cytochrome b5-like Heme/Steroid binding domain protein n=1 Tax=Caloramator mitchellensis TaxID=908809 RepID=A0A0R3JRR6_CALMK|nr:cytochrome b5 domain-containing protein [Caloramator mitchellensis]KRQ86161.1 Cytochrome b5-like Heme/Steroid binding domain protein [Caloramator mitchellensis]
MSLSKYQQKFKLVMNDIEELHYNWRTAYCPIQRNFYQQKLIEKIYEAMRFIEGLSEKLKYVEVEKSIRENKIFTLEELKNFDGTNGKPAYVAVDGIVYDVTLIASWGGASHFGLLAGNDFTKEFNDCHGDRNMLKKIPVVGTLSL